MKLKDFNETFENDLKDPEYIKILLEEALNDDWPGTFLVALREVIKANGGMTKIARETSLNREGLYDALSANGNPTYATLRTILKELGLKLSLDIDQPQSKAA